MIYGLFESKKRALTEGNVRGEIKHTGRKKPNSPPPSPTPSISEGKVVKGGVNVKPTGKRPPPPKGQGGFAGNSNIVTTGGNSFIVTKRYIRVSTDATIVMQSDGYEKDSGEWEECKKVNE